MTSQCDRVPYRGAPIFCRGIYCYIALEPYEAWRGKCGGQEEANPTQNLQRNREKKQQITCRPNTAISQDNKHREYHTPAPTKHVRQHVTSRPGGSTRVKTGGSIPPPDVTPPRLLPNASLTSPPCPCPPPAPAPPSPLSSSSSPSLRLSPPPPPPGKTLTTGVAGAGSRPGHASSSSRVQFQSPPSSTVSPPPPPALAPAPPPPPTSPTPASPPTPRPSLFEKNARPRAAGVPPALFLGDRGGLPPPPPPPPPGYGARGDPSGARLTLALLPLRSSSLLIVRGVRGKAAPTETPPESLLALLAALPLIPGTALRPLLGVVAVAVVAVASSKSSASEESCCAMSFPTAPGSAKKCRFSIRRRSRASAALAAATEDVGDSAPGGHAGRVVCRVPSRGGAEFSSGTFFFFIVN